MDFSEEVSCVHYANVSPLSHGLMTMDWLFLRLFNADFSCNVRLLLGFPTCGVDGDEVLLNGYDKLIKVGWSEGRGVQVDFLLKRGESLS